MRAVLQRVLSASVEVDGAIKGKIGIGWLVLLGVGRDDVDQDAAWMAEKTATLRAFSDQDGKMNLSVMDVGGSILAVSQFTLFGDCRKGRRPGFSDAAPPAPADDLYQSYIRHLKALGLNVECGEFQAHMQVTLVNDGPVTLLLDSRKLF